MAALVQRQNAYADVGKSWRVRQSLQKWQLTEAPVAIPQNDIAVPVQSLSWEGHVWSEWFALDTAIASRKAKAPNTAGLYRLRCNGQAGLIYIGETGKSLLERFRQLRTATVYATQGKYAAQGKSGGPPHVAGACVRKHECAGRVIEVSWTEKPKLDKRDRKGVECELVAAYRKTIGKNPACQFAGDFEEEEANPDDPI